MHSTASASLCCCCVRLPCQVCADRTPCGRRLRDSKRTDGGGDNSDRNGSRNNASSLSACERFAIHATTPCSSWRVQFSLLSPRVCLCRTLAQMRRSLGGVRQTAVGGAAVAGQVVRATEGNGHARSTCTRAEEAEKNKAEGTAQMRIHMGLHSTKWRSTTNKMARRSID